MAKPMYSTTVTHGPSGKSRVITASDYFIMQEKARSQYNTWNAAWEKSEVARVEKERARATKEHLQQQAADSLRRARENAKSSKDQMQQLAREQVLREKNDAAAYKQALLDEATARTKNSQSDIDAVRQLLAHTLSVNDVVDWSSLKHSTPFAEPLPVLPLRPSLDLVPRRREPLRSDPEFNQPIAVPDGLGALPRKPFYRDPAFQPQLGLIKRLLTSAKEQERLAKAACDDALASWRLTCQEIERKNLGLLKSEQVRHQGHMQHLFDDAVRDWRKHADEAEAENARRQQTYEAQHAADANAWQESMALHEGHKSAYEHEQYRHNKDVDEHQHSYERGEPGAVYDYFDLVLNASSYPDLFPREWELEYSPENRMLIVDYTLPSPMDMPRVKDVKYVSTKDEYRETFYSEKETNAIYDCALYQIALRTVHELFESDYANSVDAVVFNGIVHGTDKATGKKTVACVLSLQTSKSEFLEIQLANIDPKECFKKLKGVGSSQLHGLTPIAPILQMDKTDRRFVAAYDVADRLDETTNLAAIDWEDFEHLVREVFEKEFRSTGGEVRITQASRDGGVDAVAFDPDPIRGGKIVIQAKRYSNVVGVSAVRDLYGTVMNEGATKGILVTTASYGPDSYEFAKGKPLTLLNGSNLLHLLAKHGHRASIDIKAAKAMQ